VVANGKEPEGDWTFATTGRGPNPPDNCRGDKQ